MKKTYALAIVLSLLLASCSSPETNKEDKGSAVFSFAYLTDIHLMPERHAEEGFQKAIDRVNELDPAFVLTGGDMVQDVLDQSYGRSDSLYNMYVQQSKGFNMPVYNTVGNHEVYGWHRKSEDLSGHAEFGKGMYEKRIGPRYYSFDHGGWHFMVLDAVCRSEGGHYYGKIDEEQLDWIEKDLEKTGKETPVVVSTHIPFLTTQAQLQKGARAQNPAYLVVENSRDVLLKFWEYDLKLVLQGHLHFLEDLNINNDVRFITAGAVSGRWWNNPPDHSLQEGFLMLHMGESDFTWEYVDFAWDVPGYEPGK